MTPEAGKAISVAEQQHKARAAAKAPSGSVRLSPTAAAAASAAMDQHVVTAALEKRSAALAQRLRGAVDAKRAERTAVRPPVGPTSGAPTAAPTSAPSTLAAVVDDDDEASSEEGEVDDDDGAAPAVTLAQFPSGLSGANRVKLFPETNGPIPLTALPLRGRSERGLHAWIEDVALFHMMSV